MTAAQQVYKCNDFGKGGEKCGELNPALLNSDEAWTMIETTMKELPLSEQRYQSFFFDEEVPYSGHASYLDGSVPPSNDPDEEETNQPRNDHLNFLNWHNSGASQG